MGVVQIIFTYNNAELIKMLKERGECIKGEEWKKVEKINEEIDHLKSEHLHKLTRPLSAFVTFESEEGFLRATKLS